MLTNSLASSNNSTTGAGSDAAKAFMTFLKGREAKAIIRRYGYEVR